MGTEMGLIVLLLHASTLPTLSKFLLFSFMQQSQSVRHSQSLCTLRKTIEFLFENIVSTYIVIMICIKLLSYNEDKLYRKYTFKDIGETKLYFLLKSDTVHEITFIIIYPSVG